MEKFKPFPNSVIILTLNHNKSSNLLTRAMELDGRERELFGDVRILDAGRLVHGLSLEKYVSKL